MRITPTLTHNEAWALAQFCKRLDYPAALSLQAGNLGAETREADARYLLSGVEAIRSALATAGYEQR